MQLCTFSQSAILHGLILNSCPLLLTATEAKKCPCRKRLYHVPPADLRVLSCTHPNTWNGTPIISDDAIRNRLKKPVKQKVTKEKKMTTATAPEAPPFEADQDKAPSTNGQQIATQHKPGTSLTVYDRVSDPLDFIQKIGGVLYNSKMFGCGNIDQGRALAFGFLTNKLDPFSWKQRHHIIGGNITMAAEAMLADFDSLPKCSHKIIARTHDRAAIELIEGRDKNLFEFTWAEAQEEDYAFTKAANEGKTPKKLPSGEVNPAALKDNWSTPRRRMQMLWARVISDAVGAVKPAISAGRQTPEELGVIGPEIQGEIIDAEFTVTPVTPTDTAGTEPAEAPVSDSAASSSAPLASPPTSEPIKNAPSPVPPPTAEQQVAHHQQLTEEKHALLLELKGLRDKAIEVGVLTKETFDAAIAKRNVKSARDLDVPDIAAIITGLKNRIEKASVKAGTDPVSQWANSAVNPGSSPVPN